MKIILDLQNEYQKKRSQLRDLSPFPLNVFPIEDLVDNSIFKVIFDINSSYINFIYTFVPVDFSTMTNISIKDKLRRSSYAVLKVDSSNQNLLELNEQEINFINSCITQSQLPGLITTNKDWIQAAYSLWKLEKNNDFNINDLNVDCQSNLCKVIKFITNLQYVNKVCTINS